MSKCDTLEISDYGRNYRGVSDRYGYAKNMMQYNFIYINDNI
jgi:hypothetical protein